MLLLLILCIYVFYMFSRIFKVICYSKLLTDLLPIINQYNWPFAFIKMLTKSYFSFWARLFPVIKFKRYRFDISSIIALEVLNHILSFILIIYRFFMDRKK